MSTDLILPKGFLSAGVHCGIKPDRKKLDLSLFVSESPCSAAGTFTTNLVCGAPVKVSRARLPRGTIRGVVINSGNANACTGEQGIADACWMTEQIAGLLKCESTDDILVCSTGVIGRFLPREILSKGFPDVVSGLSANAAGYHNAARGMMTTDTFPKQATREATINGHSVRISGAAKGAAMIAPNMATMLSVIMTDAPLTPDQTQSMIRKAVQQSFNCISVDGHMSTSDSVILLANGQVNCGELSDQQLEEIQSLLNEVTSELAQAIIRDAEGATHFITIDVQGTRTREEAYTVAKAVADSPLVKTAIAGGDPNWGRIISAAGYCGVAFEEADLSLKVNGFSLYEKGTPLPFIAAEVSNNIKQNRETTIELTFNSGDASIRFWTSDLTAEYVRLNADYTT
ncbi:MAG: bifunctional glutamate N-acetyltransferase/amino-acid acetyltransferase ArgJ [Planctomycetota bacterium]|nr:bifunctional glutamate N-acetyltransferase/amino-acid acetyltransferase ArgJ [Planctomycetota bacterium]MDA1212522.1 bifunctional glutamate N-acetyltransferase/amino-acid acetyltransferase ArgJ [Planctomycetota bacterium]